MCVSVFPCVLNPRLDGVAIPAQQYALLCFSCDGVNHSEVADHVDLCSWVDVIPVKGHIVAFSDDQAAVSALASSDLEGFVVSPCGLVPDSPSWFCHGSPTTYAGDYYIISVLV